MKRRTPAAVLLAWLTAAASLAAQSGISTPRDVVQGEQSGSASISGTVVTADRDPRPVRRAQVTLRDVDRGFSRLAVTDATGAFIFSDLPGGRFVVSAGKQPYLMSTYGATSPRGQGLTIVVAAVEQHRGVVIALTRGAVITGTVRDASGRPMPNIRVVGSERIQTSAGVTYRQFGGGITDDRGVYRMYGLIAGTYVVGAAGLPGALGTPVGARTTTAAEVAWARTVPAVAPGGARSAPTLAPPPGRLMRPAVTYFTSVSDAALATPITLRAGEERANVDFTLAMVPTTMLRGTVTRVDGLPVQTVGVSLVALGREPGLGPVDAMSAIVAMQGANFVISGVQPGRYLLRARGGTAPPGPGRLGGGGGGGLVAGSSNDLWAAQELVVSGEDLEGIALELAPGMSVTGRITFEGTGADRPGAGMISLTLAPPPGGVVSGIGQAVINADSTFGFRGVAPGTMFLNVTMRTGAGMTAAAPAWMVKSATLNGQDVLDTPFDVRAGLDVSNIEVTITDRVTEISGQVIDDAGRPAPMYSVIVFPVDSRYWRSGSRRIRLPQRPASDGRFAVVGLPPGDYHLALVQDFEPSEWQTPAFLQQVVPGAIQVSLGEGEKKVQDIKLAGQ